MLRGSRQLVTRKSGLSDLSPACYEEVGDFQTISTCPDGLATSPTSPRGSYRETGPSGIWDLVSIILRHGPVLFYCCQSVNSKLCCHQLLNEVRQSGWHQCLTNKLVHVKFVLLTYCMFLCYMNKKIEFYIYNYRYIYIFWYFTETMTSCFTEIFGSYQSSVEARSGISPRVSL